MVISNNDNNEIEWPQMQYGRQINTTQGSGPSQLEEITNARKWQSTWVPQPEREGEMHDNAIDWKGIARFASILTIDWKA